MSIKGPLFSEYQLNSKVYDEMFDPEFTRAPYSSLYKYISEISASDLAKKEELAKKLFMSQGITFTVYQGDEGIEKIFPFDLIPRIITASEWDFIEKGITQRLKALNLFLIDIYSDQFILKDGIIPIETIYSCPHYLREMQGMPVPHQIHIHISGIDLIRDTDGSFLVLEDNLRTPSGVSYMLENRSITKRILPDLLPRNNVRTVTNYPNSLYQNLVDLSPRSHQPTIVLLTPGIFNSAYFEHSTLARLMGIELVEGRDLVVDDHKVYMKTTNGLKQVDVIYKRVDDEYLDPLVFNRTSLLGVPGLLSAYRKGNVALVNAPGNGVADDKAIYVYVPDMIRYYLNEEPILKNVTTYQLSIEAEKEYVFENIRNMVIKRTNASGGYGMLMGHTATEPEIEEYKEQINLDPRSFIAQPIINLSTSPCYIDEKIQPRRVDLRPFALYGPKGIEIVPGGLTRVALRKGSLVVNSSQGGGSKDTWVLSKSKNDA